MLTKHTLYVFSGLPGAGKSTIAKALAKELSFPLFAKDELEAVLVKSKLVELSHKSLGYTGYELLYALAETCLKAGVSVGLDSVCGRTKIREEFFALSKKHNANFIAFECICSDITLHKERLKARIRGIEGWHELDWEEVERVKNYFEPWKNERLVLDSAEGVEELVASARTYITKYI